MNEHNDVGFTYQHAMEPHHRRRLQILAAHPELKALTGYDVRTAIVTGVVVLAQLGLAWAVQRVDLPWWGLFALAYAVGAVLSHWAGQTIHETAHHLAWPTARGNRWLALFANLPMVWPIAATFHRYHLEHHRSLGVEGRDTDLPHAFEVRHVGRSRWRKALWLTFYFFVYALRGATFVKPLNRAEWVNLALQLGFNVVLWFVVGPWGLTYLALSTIIGHSLHPVAAHFIHEHYALAGKQETFSYYGPLNHVTFNVGYHVEHHDFMNVPGWRLPELHRLASEFYVPLVSHRSWTWVLWEFVTSRTLGVGSRLVRTVDDFAKGRSAREQPMPDWSA